MSAPRPKDFCPDWKSSPGDTIADVMEEKGLSEAALAIQLGQSADDVCALLEGRAAVSIEIARSLQRTLGGSVEFWMSRDFQYRREVDRASVDEKELLRKLPLGDMIRFGWISRAPRPSEELAACCQFFNVPDKNALVAMCSSVQHMVAFRASPSFESWPAATAAWLRQGEIEADKIRCHNWNANAFEKHLAAIRPLTREKDPRRFLPALQKVFAECGVAVVVVRCPTGCRSSGAARFINPGKAVLQLSFRFLTDDHLWFTLFHEAGHLLLHLQGQLFREDELYLEGDDTEQSKDEVEANAFAQKMLIPDSFRKEMLGLPRDARAIMRFARRIGVSRGIVVGQLQHAGKIRPNQMNKLKARYNWDDMTF